MYRKKFKNLSLLDDTPLFLKYNLNGAFVNRPVGNDDFGEKILDIDHRQSQG